jgi:hypothetical protein
VSGEGGYTKSSKGDATQFVHGDRNWLVEGMSSDTVLGMNSQTVVGMNNITVAGLQCGMFVVGVQTLVLGGIDNVVWGWASDYASSWTEEHPVHVEKHGTRTVTVTGASMESVVGLKSLVAGVLNLGAEGDMALAAPLITRSAAAIVDESTGSYSNFASESTLGGTATMSVIGGGSNLELAPGTAELNGDTVFINGDMIYLGQPAVPEEVEAEEEEDEEEEEDDEEDEAEDEDEDDQTIDDEEDPPTDDEEDSNQAEEEPAGGGEETGGTDRNDEPAPDEPYIDFTEGPDGEDLGDAGEGSAGTSDPVTDPVTGDPHGESNSEEEAIDDAALDEGDDRSVQAEHDGEDPEDLDADEDGREQLTRTKQRDGTWKENWIDEDGNPRQRIVDEEGNVVRTSRWAKLMKKLPSRYDVALRAARGLLALLEGS